MHLKAYVLLVNFRGGKLTAFFVLFSGVNGFNHVAGSTGSNARLTCTPELHSCGW